MQSALTPPFAVAALVLCIAGVAKLRSPSGAALAIVSAGLPTGAGKAVRPLAIAEVALGTWCLLEPTTVAASALAGVYAVFAGLAALLARRGAACGCFGERQDDREVPASAIQALLSIAIAIVALAGAIAPPHGIGWILAHHPAVLALGTAGSAYAAVLVYTELPRAWSSWSAR